MLLQITVRKQILERESIMHELKKEIKETKGSSKIFIFFQVQETHTNFRPEKTKSIENEKDMTLGEHEKGLMFKEKRKVYPSHKQLKEKYSRLKWRKVLRYDLNFNFKCN